MTQIVKKLKPLTVNTDTSLYDLKDTESPFLRGYELSIGKDGKANEGGNFGVGKKSPSNFRTISIDLPDTGTNKSIGFFEAEELNEAYVFNWNSDKLHGIYRLDGVNLTCQRLCLKKELDFSIDPKHAIPPHRVKLQVVYGIDENGERIVKEKFLIFTDGRGWQHFITVISAIATDGFNTPYFKLQPPHFDANELIDYITRPPMYAPVINPVKPVTDDLSKQNFLLDKSTQFAYRYIMTDGRPTTLSWFSTPYFTQPSTCDINNINSPRCLDLGLYAGSALVEQIQILVRYNGLSSTDGISLSSDWALYDTIDKFDTDGENDPKIIKNEYWKRTNPWKQFSYNEADNTITYRYCGDKGTTQFSVGDALMVQNDVPLKSFALTGAGDVIIWGDNLRFYPNFPKTTMDNLSLDVVDGKSSNGDCSLKTVKVTLYSTFHTCVAAYKNGEADPKRYFSRGYFDVTTSAAAFSVDHANGFGLDYGENEGQICYFAGTSYYALGVQYKVDQLGNKTKIGLIDITNKEQVQSIYALYATGGYLMYQYDFEVPQGNYIARLCKHSASLSSDYELTSTYVLGIANRSRLRELPQPGIGTTDLPDDLFYNTKELEIDATAGSVDFWDNKKIFLQFCPFRPYFDGSTYKTFFIYPFDNPHWSQSWRFIEGYLKDNVDSIDGIDPTTTIGVELVDYMASLGDNTKKVTGGATDHNGYFFAFTADDNSLFDSGDARSSEVIFSAKLNCGAYTPGIIKTQINISKKSGLYPNENINLGDINSRQGNFIAVNGKIKNCATGNGISGVGVTVAKGKTYYTDSEGNYSVRVHTLNAFTRKENIFINGNGNCLFSNCDCGIIGIVPFDASGIDCTNDAPRAAPVMSDILFKIVTINGKSLKGGGRYPVSIIGHDLGGRKTAACLIGYISIPTFLEKGNFSPSQIRVNINGALKLPADMKWITFAIGNNLNTNKYLQWVGDKIEFLDSKGNLTGDGNGAVRARITIQSLLDFNIRENFATTATYQFVKNDTLRIYDDGLGNLFTPELNKGFLDYPVLGTNFDETVDPTTTVTTTNDGSTTTTATTVHTQDPKSFIIEYDQRLLALKDKCGFWIELNRTIPVTDKEPFFGISGTYPVFNGDIEPKSIILDAFDTYYQRRNIIIDGCSGANFNHPFESQSITDYWGENVNSSGMVLFKDPQAQQKWYLNDTIKSDAFVNQGRVNGLGICRSENRKDFKDQTWGGIIAMHAERDIIAFICQNDWFICDFNMNYARVDGSGRIVANPETNGVGNPYQKVGDNFGCEYEDVSTINFYDGLALWADRKNSGFIIMNYRQAFDIATVENKGYFIEKFKHLMRFNTSINNDLYNIMETCSGINPNNDQVYITFRNRKGLDSSPVNFVNNEDGVIYEKSETFIYSLNLKKWVGWAPYAPEYYGSMKHSQSGTEFITFANGDAWFHNSKGVKGFMKFYGVNTDQSIHVVSNFDQSKLKIFQSIAIESAEVKYFIRKITTDQKTCMSYIPLNYFKKKGNVWYAELLRDMNSYPDPTRPAVSMLQDGKSITGQFAEFQLVSDPETSEEYSELNNILVRFIGSEKSEK